MPDALTATTPIPAPATPQAAPPAPNPSPSLPEGADGAASGAAVPETPPEPTKLQRARAAADALIDRGRARRAAEAARTDALTRAAAAERAVAEERAARERAEASLRAIDADPLGQLTKRGLTSKAIAQAAIDDGTPEAIARRALERADAADKRVEAIEQQAQERSARQASEAQVQAANAAFVDQAKAAADDYPWVAAHATARPSALVAEARAIIAEHGGAFRARYGREPTNVDVLKYLEWQYSEAEKARKPSAPTTAPAAPETAPTDGAPKPAPVSASARTLTGRTAERATLPADFGKLSKEEQKAEMARQIRALRRA